MELKVKRVLFAVALPAALLLALICSIFIFRGRMPEKSQRPYSLTELENCTEVPLLLQNDDRWAQQIYAGEPMELSGCGPVCLSMVGIYLLEDTALDPGYIAQFSQRNGFSERGNGSKWTLISEGGPLLGLDVTELPLDRDRILRNLEVGNPIICVMGPGDFTTTGHFIVLTGLEDGKITLNDPNSQERSGQLWDYETLEPQFRNLWACRR